MKSMDATDRNRPGIQIFCRAIEQTLPKPIGAVRHGGIRDYNPDNNPQLSLGSNHSPDSNKAVSRDEAPISSGVGFTTSLAL